MWLKNLSAINFKNYAGVELEFSAAVNAFTGDNGGGKTNLLDAIHYLSLCKSYFNPIDTQQIKQDAEFFMVAGTFENNSNEDKIACSLKRNQKKRFRRNKKDYQRLADHIGLYPLVMISPYDTSIIMDGSEDRRKFIDNAISQTDNKYLDELISYVKILANRNALLKQISEKSRYDPHLLEVYDDQLASSGMRIFEKRKLFMEKFVPIFKEHYKYLSEDAEAVELVYDSQLLGNSFMELLKNSTEKDRALERTTVGIHKDDMLFTIHGMPLKKFGSQGQQKSFLIALKLSQYSYLLQLKGFKPLLLLDDIFDKLDEKRTQRLMRMVSEDGFGQIFITDTSRIRIERIFNDIDVKVKIFDIVKGSVSSDHEPN